MAICGSDMFEFSVRKDMKNKNPCFIGRKVAIGKVAPHFSLTLIVKELKISVEQGRVVTTLKYNQTLNILFSVV